MRSWLRTSAHSFGATVDPQTLYELGLDWYAKRLDVDWVPATPTQATQTFARHGLVGDFWSIE